MKTVAFVPIKLNNERLPGKNTKELNGVPLLKYILNTLREVKAIEEVYVYCSDESICEYLPNGVTFLKRSPHLDLSTTSFNDVLTSFANDVEADIYVLTHATAPFIKMESFERGIEAVSSEVYDSALSVERLQEFLWKDGKPYNYNPINIPRTQDLEPYFTETCGMYIYTKDLIINQKRRIGDRPYLVEVSKVEACDINSPEDFEVAEAFAMYVRGGV